MEIKRKKYQGVKNILSFNRHFYIIGITVLMIIIIIHLVLNLSRFTMWFSVFAFSYGLIMPLIVSAYVYDYSGYYNFKWLKTLDFKKNESLKIININAGFDETSYIIKKYFPLSELKVFDFYNSKKHTEKAIKRARKVSIVYPNTKKIKTNLIPINDNSIDMVFILSAAHEIRSQKEKVIFLKECNRIIKKNGKIIMVEHLRDISNFLAFSIGFTHFFSKKTWLTALKKAEFKKISEQKFTPFLSIFNISK